ncbi:MAG: OmpA family protein [Spirosomataceae bacterium]
MKGIEGQRFDLKLSGDGFEEQSVAFSFNDSLINRSSLVLKLTRPFYDFEFSVSSRKDRNPIAKAQLKVIDLESKNEIPLKIVGSKISTGLQSHKQYSLQIRAEGYEEFNTRIETLKWIADGDFEKNVSTHSNFYTCGGQQTRCRPSQTAPIIIETKTFGKIEKGKSIILKNIYFDQSSPVLRPDSYPELDALTEVLSQNPTIRIEIRGHTDNVGDFDLNVKLSKDRCLSVEAYLIKKD